MEEKQNDIAGWCYLCGSPVCNNTNFISNQKEGRPVIYICEDCRERFGY